MKPDLRMSGCLLPILALCLAASMEDKLLAGGTVSDLTQANLEAALNGGGNVSFAVSGTLILTNTLTIGSDTFMDANGNTVTLSGGNAVRLFVVNTNVHLEIRRVTLANGAAVGVNGVDGIDPTAGGDAFGGGILNNGGVVTLLSCALEQNVAQGGKAGQVTNNAYTSVAKGGNAWGGALVNLGGTVNLTNCILTGNQANGGMGTSGNAYPFDWGGDGGSARGGALYCAGGIMNLSGLSIVQNTASGGPRTSGQAGSVAGGALFVQNATLSVSSCVVISNQVAGGPTTDDWATSGSGGAALGGAFLLGQGSTCTVQLCNFFNNSAQGGTGNSFSSGGAAQGGAVCSEGYLEISNSGFLTNATAGGRGTGPGIWELPPPGQGGAIYSTRSLILNGCVFASNSAVGAAYGGYHLYQSGGSGGGGALWSSGLLRATNSTLAGNRAAGGTAMLGSSGVGGGFCLTGGDAALVNLTIAGNRAEGSDFSGPTSYGALGGGLSSTNGQVIVRNSIIANNINGGQVAGTVIDGGYNICSDDTAKFSASGSLNQIDPLLAPLADNGGPTATMLLLAGSPARDAVPSGFPPVDQRGIARPQGTAADIGAVEAPPVFRLEVRRLSNGLGIGFKAVQSGNYRLLSSTNLHDWVGIATNTAAAGQVWQYLLEGGSNPHGFYRLVTP